MNSFLPLINDILQSIIVIFGASILLYNLHYIGRDRIMRAFTLLLAAVITVYLTELLISRTLGDEMAEPWLYPKWIGIIFVPAIQFHLSDALLGSTGLPNIRRHFISSLAYIATFIFILLLLFTDTIVSSAAFIENATHFRAGSFFWLFSLYFWILTIATIRHVWRAWKRCITTTTRRQMGYILLAIIAAPLSVFPYLAIFPSSMEHVPLLLWLLLIAGNLLVGFLFSVLTLNILYLGSLSSQRIVRVRLYKFMARVPFTASMVLLVYILTSRTSDIWGVGRETAVASAVVGTVMIIEWSIHAYKDVLERVLQFNNEPDVRRIQQLSERLLTSQDLKQYLEGVLAAGCNRIQAPGAFIVSLSAIGSKLEVLIDSPQIEQDVAQFDHLPTPAELEGTTDFLTWHNYLITPLYTRQRDAIVGVLGIMAHENILHSSDQIRVLQRLTTQTASALEDRLLQNDVFAAVEGILPSITALQQARGETQFGGQQLLNDELTGEDNSVATNSDFRKQVKQALKDIYGGRGLTESPLLELHIVQTAATNYDNDPVKALKAILKRAIDMQKPPESEQSLTRTEWLLYNILELEFLQGHKIRQVANRLAISESTYYRRKRDAIENVARTIGEMELKQIITTD